MFVMNKATELSETKTVIELVAPGKTDFFIDTRNQIENNNAPFYYEKRTGDFTISAMVKPEFLKTYDAGGLFVFDSMKKWIKLEFEKTDIGYSSVVSVVTNGSSDDCNGEKIEGTDEIYLQIVRNTDYWALHYSIDGKNWKMNRYFQLKMKNEVKVGIEAQSPIGKGCRVLFSKLKISENRIKNMRKGK